MKNTSNRTTLSVTQLESRDVPAPLAFAPAFDAGPIRVYEEDRTSSLIANPFLGFTGPINIVVADLIGVGNVPDGKADFVLAAGQGGAPRVVIVDGATRALARDFMVFDPNFRGGATIAVADVIGDGALDLIAGAGAGGGPQVNLFDGAPIRAGATPPAAIQFFAFDARFRGGVSVAAGEHISGPGNSGIVVGAGMGGGPNVRVFHTPLKGRTGEVQLALDFMAFDPQFQGGVNVAVGALNNVGFNSEIIVGAGPGGGPNVRVFEDAFGFKDTRIVRTADFFAYEKTINTGVFVGSGNVPGTFGISVLAGPEKGAGPRVRAFEPSRFESIFDGFVDQTESRSGATVSTGVN